MKSISVLPVFVKDELSGIISLGHLAASAHSEEDLRYVVKSLIRWPWLSPMRGWSMSREN